MAHDEDLNEAAAKHIRDLDEHLERLKRQNDTLDAITAEQDAEVARLKQMLSDVGERFGSREPDADAPPE